MKKILIVLLIMIVMPLNVYASESCNSCVYYPVLSCNKKTELFVNVSVGISNGKIVYSTHKEASVSNSCRNFTWDAVSYKIKLEFNSNDFENSCPDFYYFDNEKKAYLKNELPYSADQMLALMQNGDVQKLVGTQRKKATCREEINKLSEQLEENKIERTCKYKKDNITKTITVKDGEITASDGGRTYDLDISDFKNSCPKYMRITVTTGFVPFPVYHAESSYNESYYILEDNSESAPPTPTPEEPPLEPVTTCGGLLGEPGTTGTPAYYLQKAFDIIKYIALVALVVLTAADIAKAVMSENKDMQKELTRKLFLRLIYAVCIFFIPDIVKLLLSVTGVYGDCAIS